jgi:uncharacterized protein (DUF58 family)
MRSSLARRALAILVLVIVAILAVRIVIGVISAVFWMVALVVLAVAALWAVATLRSAGRERAEKRQVRPAPAHTLPVATHKDRVEAEMRKIREQLREQGRS